jgi:hypothetical protein
MFSRRARSRHHGSERSLGIERCDDEIISPWPVLRPAFVPFLEDRRRVRRSR